MRRRTSREAAGEAHPARLNTWQRGVDPEGGGPASGEGGAESTASGVPLETFGSWDLEFPPQISGNTLLSAADPAVNSSLKTRGSFLLRETHPGRETGTGRRGAGGVRFDSGSSRRAAGGRRGRTDPDGGPRSETENRYGRGARNRPTRRRSQSLPAGTGARALGLAWVVATWFRAGRTRPSFSKNRMNLAKQRRSSPTSPTSYRAQRPPRARPAPLPRHPPGPPSAPRPPPGLRRRLLRTAKAGPPTRSSSSPP